MPWAKERMPEIFEGTKLLENGEDLVKITKVDTMNGECHINTRKGKIFHFFEFEIKLKWTGTRLCCTQTIGSVFLKVLSPLTSLPPFTIRRHHQGRQSGGQHRHARDLVRERH
jgi:hypothetical protein